MLVLACNSALLVHSSGNVAVEDGGGGGVATGIDVAVLRGDDQSSFCSAQKRKFSEFVEKPQFAFGKEGGAIRILQKTERKKKP